MDGAARAANTWWSGPRSGMEEGNEYRLEERGVGGGGARLSKVEGRADQFPRKHLLFVTVHTATNHDPRYHTIIQHLPRNDRL